jgi:hypothetical protein
VGGTRHIGSPGFGPFGPAGRSYHRASMGASPSGFRPWTEQTPVFFSRTDRLDHPRG